MSVWLKPILMVRYLYINNDPLLNASSKWNHSITDVNLDANGKLNFDIRDTGSSVNTIGTYSFVFYRPLIGAEAGETLEAGDNYDYIDGGAGDDIHQRQ